MYGALGTRTHVPTAQRALQQSQRMNCSSVQLVTRGKWSWQRSGDFQKSLGIGTSVQRMGRTGWRMMRAVKARKGAVLAAIASPPIPSFPSLDTPFCIHLDMHQKIAGKDPSRSITTMETYIWGKRINVLFSRVGFCDSSTSQNAAHALVVAAEPAL